MEGLPRGRRCPGPRGNVDSVGGDLGFKTNYDMGLFVGGFSKLFKNLRPISQGFYFGGRQDTPKLVI
jgi:hypothetical protein